MMRGGLAGLTGLVAVLLAGAAGAADPAACRFAPAAAGPASNAFERLVALTNEQRGLGGTGIVAQREERGLGGTGISSTGIIGVVTGFGSICVNGFEVQMAANTTVTVEGLPANEGDVRLGQVVAVEAFTGANGLSAARVNVAVAVAGPVSAITRDRSQLTVAGQTVDVENFAGSADISAVRRGDWVVVSGLRRADDSIAGTSIVKLPQRGREIFVSGTARGAAGRVEIGDLPITAAQVSPGATVAVRGTLSGGALRARAVDAVAGFSPGFSQGVTSVSVQAYGPHVATELNRLGLTGPAAPMEAAVPTQVDGAVGPGGALIPQRVEAAPSPAIRPDAPTPPPVMAVRPLPGAPLTPVPRPTAPVRPVGPLPAERPVIPDAARPVVPERIAPPPRPERPPVPERPE